MKLRAPGDVGDPKARDADFPKIEGKELRVFPEDVDLPKDQINDRVDEVFVPIAEVKVPEKKEDFAAWKAGLVKKLQEKSFRAVPEKVPVREAVGPLNRDLSQTRWRAPGEPDICTYVLQIGKGGKLEFASEALIVLNADENTGAAGAAWSKATSDAYSLVAIATRGTGSGQWTRKNPPNTVERSLALLGETADTGRVRDVESMLILKDPHHRFRLVGRGPGGLIAAYAALLAPNNVEEVIILDPPTSHRDGPQFLNVDRVLDLPTALGLLAPDVKLTLINAKDKAFDKTAAIYKLAGAEGKFERK
jgi:hypothetical protein